MALSQVQKIFVQQLKNLGADRNMVIGISLMLKKSEQSLIELILWIEDNNPTLDEISEKALEICDNLPPELRPA